MQISDKLFTAWTEARQTGDGALFPAFCQWRGYKVSRGAYYKVHETGTCNQHTYEALNDYYSGGREAYLEHRDAEAVERITK